MKHGKKPTYEQRKLLTANGYDPYAWLVIKDTPQFMQIASREGGAIITIEKD